MLLHLSEHEAALLIGAASAQAAKLMVYAMEDGEASVFDRVQFEQDARALVRVLQRLRKVTAYNDQQ